MISEKMQSMINDQINYELFSSYLYYAMAAYFEESDLPGFANWMQVQTREELLHVDKFFNYVNERDGRVTLKAIEAPKTSWESPLEAFQEALEHERSVSARINELAKQALSEGDHATNFFLQWFINEQIEEEASARDIVQRLRRFGQDGHTLFMIDRELAQRVLTLPTPTDTGA